MALLAQHQARKRAAIQRPTPNYELPAPLAAAQPALSLTIPGLHLADCVTISARVRLVNPVSQYSFIAGILSSNGGYTDVGSSNSGYLQMNTYGPGFWTTLFQSPLSDGLEHTVTFQLYPNRQRTKLKIYCDGHLLALQDSATPPSADQYGQNNQDFTDTFTIGATNGARFEGDIITLTVSNYEVSEAQCLAF